jgi:hypothetical protein
MSNLRMPGAITPLIYFHDVELKYDWVSFTLLTYYAGKVETITYK